MRPRISSHHQDGNQRDGKQRREKHREGLGEGQRLKEPSGLSFQREDRDERDGDDQQRKEERAAHLARGMQDGFDLARELVRSPLLADRACSSSLWAFSIMMIAASTMAPMAMAMPPSDMMFAVRCIAANGMNESSTAVGSMMMATSALRRCQRKTTQTRLTMMLSSISFPRSVSMERRISCERS